MGVFTRKDTIDEDPMAKRVLAALMVLALEIIVVAGMIPRTFTDAQINKEIQAISSIMGEDRALAVQKRAQVWFNDYFVQTGAYDATFRFFIPTEAQRRKSKGMEDLGQDRLFPFVEKTLVSIWTGILQTTLRLSHYLMWWPFFLLAVLPAIGDAIYQRKIKQASFKHSSSVRYRYAINMFGTVVFLFLFSLFLPLAIPPFVVPVGFALAAMAAAVIFSNLQKKI